MIGAKRVTAPEGTTWQVGRRWLPDKPTLRRRKDRDIVVLALELLIVLVLLFAGLAGRFLLRKP